MVWFSAPTERSRQTILVKSEHSPTLRDSLWSKLAVELTVISPPVPTNVNQRPLSPIVQEVVFVPFEPTDEYVTGSALHSTGIAVSQILASVGNSPAHSQSSPITSLIVVGFKSSQASPKLADASGQS